MGHRTRARAERRVLALGGLLAGTRNRRALALPGIVLGLLVQHALPGWCPPIAVFRRLGIRTRREIDAEEHALRVLRGDFDAALRRELAERADAVVDAVVDAG